MKKLESFIVWRDHVVFNINKNLLLIMYLRIVQVAVVDFVQDLIVFFFVQLLDILFLKFFLLLFNLEI